MIENTVTASRKSLPVKTLFIEVFMSRSTPADDSVTCTSSGIDCSEIEKSMNFISVKCLFVVT